MFLDYLVGSNWKSLNNGINIRESSNLINATSANDRVLNKNSYCNYGCSNFNDKVHKFESPGFIFIL